MNARTYSIMGSFAVVALSGHALPYLHRFLWGRLFGVSVPSAVLDGDEGRRLVRRYEFALLPWTVIAFLVVIALPVSWATAWRTGVVVMTCLGICAAYAWAYQAAQAFAVPKRSWREAPLTDSADGRRIMRSFGPPLGIVAMMTLWLRVSWSRIPQRYPVHWHDGVANGWSYRTASGIFGPAVFAASLILGLAGFCYLMLRGSRRTAPTSVPLGLASGVAYFGTLFVSINGVLALGAIPEGFLIWIVLAFVVAWLAFVVAVIIKALGNPVSDDSMPDERWIGGMVYYNPEDPALFVQSRTGNFVGPNFGNRASWWLTALLIAYVVGMIGLAKVVFS